MTTDFNWFDLAWPWVGLGFATVLIILLFATNRLRTDTTQPRWRDLRWLSFLSIAPYLVHQVEEYGIAANGIRHAFPDGLCIALGQPPYAACAIPPAFYLAVNIALVWVAAPIAALSSRRFSLAGLTLLGVIVVNAIVHTVPALATQRYDAGLVTAVFIFIPLTALIITRIKARDTLVLLAAGVFMHVTLGGGVMLFLHGQIPAWVLVGAQPTGITLGYLAVARLRS